MLNAVTVTNHLGDSLTMELRNPEKSGFLITSITGIGAPKANINITDLAATDGGYYNSSRAQTRNIVLGIRFYSEDNTNIEALRQKTYRYFPVKRTVKLKFAEDNRVGEISGYVESNEPNIFSKEEDCQISVICPYPYFYNADGEVDKEISFSNIEPVFFFRAAPKPEGGEWHPYPVGPVNTVSGESEYYDRTTRKHIVFSHNTRDYRHIVIYDGDADTGMRITLTATGRVVNPEFYNLTTGETISLITTMEANDSIIIDTVSGGKKVRRLRNGKYTNIINTISRNSSWPTLQKGENITGYMADDGVDYLSASISHKTLFEGM